MSYDDSAPEPTDQLQRLALIGHDVRTPLHNIHGFAQLISSSDDAPDNVRRWAEHINVSSVELSLMIDSLLRLGAIDAAAKPPSLRSVDSCYVIEDVLTSLAGTAEASGKVIRLEIPPIRPLVSANQRDLIDAYLRLVHNAIRYSSGSEIVVTVAPHSPQATGSTVVTTTVADGGEGFHRDQFSNLVRRFARGPEVSGVGLGLGLTIASHLIEGCGGTLSYRNDDVQSSTFSVSIPAAASEVETQAK